MSQSNVYTKVQSNSDKYATFDSERGIFIMHNFPITPEKNEGHLRPAKEIAKRALALHLLLGVIFYEEPKDIVEWAIEEGLWDSLSPQEQQVFAFPISNHDEGEKRWRQKAMQSNRLTWRIEGLLALLWCLGKVEHLDLPIEKCDGSILSEVLPQIGESLDAFISQAQLRPVEDLVYLLQQHIQIHKDQQKAFENNESLPFDMLITYERIHALYWTVSLIDQWDD